MSTAKVVASNTAYQFIGKFVTMACAILITGLLTRYYGSSGYGAYSLIISFPALFFIISDFGLNAVATRHLSVHEENINRYLGSISLLRILFSVILMIVASTVVLILPYPSYVKVGIWISLITILTTSIISSSNIGFQVKLRYDLASMASVIGTLTGFFLVLFLVLNRQNIIVIVIAIVLTEVLKSVLSLYFLRKLGIKPNYVWDTKILYSLIISAIPLGLMFVFSQINFKADSILLSLLALPKAFGNTNIQAVGIYGLPYKVFEVSLIVPTYLMNSFYPIMVRDHAISQKKLLQVFSKPFFLLLGLGVLCALLSVIFAKPIIEALGGEGFSQSVQILKILLGFSFVFYLTQPLAWLIVTLGEQKYLPLIYFIASIVNVALNVLFIPRYSFIASAHITWISESVILILLTLTALRLLRRKA